MPVARLWLFALLACLAVPTTGAAQITFNYDYSNGSGFSGSVANPGYYTTARRDAVERAGTYLTTQFDGRGTVTVKLGTQTSAQVGGGTLAQAGTSFSIASGTATNGSAFQQATTTTAASSSGQIFMDFNSDQANWFTGAGTSASSGQFDMQSVTLHELSHGLGFLSLIDTSNGSGINGSSTWSQLDANLRVGPGASAPKLLSGTQGSYAFNSGAVSTADLNGTNVYFHGEFAKAANGGNAVQMADSGDLSHLGATVANANAVMLPGIGAGTDRRAYQNLELGMMIDNGWNQFVWKNATGNFADNVSSVSTNARWRNLDGADMLSPVGTITPNMVLRFGGTGGYTATNDLTLAATAATGSDPNRFLLTRMILNATAGTSTIAATGSNTFRFDSTIGVVPQIRQDGAGAFVISHPLELTGRNLQLAGDGAGLVTLSGTIGQQAGQVGSITKLGTSTFVLSGANTYSGGTTINGGTLTVAAGSSLGTGAVNINATGTLGRVGTGSLATGNVTVASNGTLSTNLAATGTASQLALGANVLDLKTGAKLRLTALAGFSNSAAASYTLALLDSGTNLKKDGTTVANGFVFGTFIQGTGNGGTNAVVFDTSGFGVTLNTGDTFTLARSGNNLVLSFAPVPEPVAVLAVGAAGLGAITWLRRRKVVRAEPTTAA